MVPYVMEFLSFPQMQDISVAAFSVLTQYGLPSGGNAEVTLLVDGDPKAVGLYWEAASRHHRSRRLPQHKSTGAWPTLAQRKALRRQRRLVAEEGDLYRRAGT